jgi:5-methyltetrahydrofolate--homocysteine methyltransferase
MKIDELLLQKSVQFDGGTGTEYQKRGLTIGESPEALTLEMPSIVEQVHREYLDAGAKVIETNTFGGNKKRLQSAGLDKRISEINGLAAEIALRSANGKAVVAGSVGPLGVLLEPYGDISQTEAMELFGEQVGYLLKAGIELILVETMISLEEAILALRAAREAGAKTVGVTLTFELTPDGPKTAFGESPTTCLQALEQSGASLVGSNCGNGFEVMRAVAKEMKSVSKIPIIIQPNAGIPTLAGNQVTYPESPAHYARFVRELLDLNVQFVGGCCGTTPDHIRAAARIGSAS